MRDKGIIFDFCKRLAVAWMRNTDLRFSQILSEIFKDSNLLIKDDKEVIEDIEKYMNQFGEENEI